MDYPAVAPVPCESEQAMHASTTPAGQGGDPEAECRKWALILVDLQNGPLSLAEGPGSGDRARTTALRVAAACRAVGVLVIMVYASSFGDGGDRLSGPVDEPVPVPSPPPPDFFDFGSGVETAADIFVVKRQWGGFYGTDLDLQLRRRRISHVAIGGVLTNFGVESTARNAWEHGYKVVIIEDATAALTQDDQTFAVTRVFPRIGGVLTADGFLDALGSPDEGHASA
jgi:nicotinamidase-related amidase